MKTSFTLLVVALLASGCVTTNPYSQFYQDQTGGQDISQLPNIEHPDGDPKVFRGTNVDADGQRMLEEGYVLLGYSSFNGGNVNEQNAVMHGRRIGASVVITYSQYTHTLSGSLPITTPDIQTATTHGSATAFGSGTAYGSGGYANYSGSGTAFGSSQTTVYGSRTTYVPYNVARYDYLATFWVKTKASIFGTRVVDLTAEQHREIGSNQGVMVGVVIKDTPAYKADLFKGDIIVKLGDVRLDTAKSYYEALPALAGQEVTVDIIRAGKNITKTVQLNNIPNAEAAAAASAQNKE